MNRGINLVKETKKKTKVVSKNLILLRFIALFILFGISFFAIVIFLFITISPLPQLQRQEKELTTRLLLKSEMIAKLLIVHDRLQTSDSLITKRSSFAQKISLIKKYLPANVVIDSYSLEKNKISFTVKSSSLALIDRFSQNISESDEIKNQTKEITFSDFTYSATGRSFFITLNMTL